MNISASISIGGNSQSDISISHPTLTNTPAISVITGTQSKKEGICDLMSTFNVPARKLYKDESSTILNAYYQISTYPSMAEKRELALKIGLTLQSVNNWSIFPLFQLTSQGFKIADKVKRNV